MKYIYPALFSGLSAMAMAEDFVRIGGKLEAGVHAYEKDGSRGRNIQDAGSEIDISGAADIAAGLNAFFQVNTDIRLGNSSGPTHFASGDTFAGLRGDAGALKLGRGINAYGDGYFKGNFYQYDPSPVNAGIPAGGGERRGAIKYEAPLRDGLALAVSYAPDKHGTRGNNDAWAVSGTYEQGGFGMRLSQAGQHHPGGRDKQDTLLAFRLQPQPGLTLSLELDYGRGATGQRQFGSAGYAEYKPARLGVRAGYLTARHAGFVRGAIQRTALLGADYDLSRGRFPGSVFMEYKSDHGAVRGKDLMLGLHVGF